MNDPPPMVWLCLQFYAGRMCSTGFAESEAHYRGRKVVLCNLWINTPWNMESQKFLSYLGGGVSKKNEIEELRNKIKSLEKLLAPANNVETATVVDLQNNDLQNKLDF